MTIQDTAAALSVFSREWQEWHTGQEARLAPADCPALAWTDSRGGGGMGVGRSGRHAAGSPLGPARQVPVMAWPSCWKEQVDPSLTPRQAWRASGGGWRCYWCGRWDTAR